MFKGKKNLQSVDEQKKQDVEASKDKLIDKEVKETVKANKPTKRKKVSKFKIKLILWLIFVSVLIGSGAAGGIYLYSNYYPKINSWLTKHNFKKGDVNNTNQETTNELKNRVNYNVQDYEYSKELIPTIVSNVSSGVVSIAVSNADLVPGQGIVNRTDRIGTGFIIDSKGVIVTNQHVVSDTNADYEVITNDNKSFIVTKILRDPVNDIALVFIDPQGTNLKPLPLGDSDKILVGQTVIAIGTPLGEFPGTVTVGVISGLHRTVVAGSSFLGSVKQYENVIQTDAAINPGNSGGPLINLDGQVIGINFATTSGADNISFALPINVVKARLNEYNTYGKFRFPFLGVRYVYISPQDAVRAGVPQGALVKGVVPDSPAQKVGVLPGDIIVQIDGKEVNANLWYLVQKHNVGDTITIKIWRYDKTSDKGEYKTLQVTLMERE